MAATFLGAEPPGFAAQFAPRFLNRVSQVRFLPGAPNIRSQLWRFGRYVPHRLPIGGAFPRLASASASLRDGQRGRSPRLTEPGEAERVLDPGEDGVVRQRVHVGRMLRDAQ